MPNNIFLRGTDTPATGPNSGFPPQYSQQIKNLMTSQQGDSVVVSPKGTSSFAGSPAQPSGDLLVAVAIGLKPYPPFDLLHGASPNVGFLAGLNDFNANPTISDAVGNTWTLAANINLVDSDPAVPSYTTSSQWNLDGYYPSLYVWVAQNVIAGSYKVNLNSMYKDSIVRPGGLSSGRPIFEGGVDFQVFTFAGAALTGAVTGSSIGVSAFPTNNPAEAPASIALIGANGGILFAVGLQKSGNVFGPGTVGVGAGSPPAGGATMTQIANGRLVGSEAHWMVEYLPVASGNYVPNFINPLSYEMVIASLAIKSS